MKLTPVDSSSIAAAGFEGDTLRIQFKTGKTYDYKPVPRSVWVQFGQAKSAGQFFSSQIRGVFPHTEVKA